MKKVSLSNIAFVVVIAAGFLYYLYLKGYIFANFENLEPKEAYQLLQKEKGKIVLLDVRNPEEIKTDGKIPGSILIPLGTLAQNIDKLDKNKKIMVYCHSGMRSVSAARLLSSVGFKVLNIKGGILSWKSEGLPVEK
ncbi:rhodanese-like domain-containing protein [Persephonella sp. IF05-L8]|uniref:rhodanese-like domain-containing protein n=1 Tax=Persephonella sp. IF05-L8 TaxID=1158338 RepID=UPI0004982DA8